MFGFYYRSPIKKLQRQQKALLFGSFQAQRNGNILLYSSLTAFAGIYGIGVVAVRVMTSARISPCPACWSYRSPMKYGAKSGDALLTLFIPEPCSQL